MKKLLPLVLLLVGIGSGIGAGIALAPEAPIVESETEQHAHTELPELDIDEPEIPEDEIREYVKLSNQFVVPLVKEGSVVSLVVLSLSVEVLPGAREGIFLREPRIRDSFLRVLFDYANIGGFENDFTNVNRLNRLRSSLLEVATYDGGDQVTDVLILEIAKQDF